MMGLFVVIFHALVLSISALPAQPLGANCSFDRLATRPRLFRCKGFADQEWVTALSNESEAILEAKQTCKERKCRAYAQEEDLPSMPAVTALMEALYALLPEQAAAEARRDFQSQPLNVLTYEVGGETLGWHTDAQEQDPADLIASAILYIGRPDTGGETTFRSAEPLPVVVPPNPGDLAIFMSCDASGDDDQKSLHKGVKVAAGRKLVLEKFFALPRWFCTEGFTFEAPEAVTLLEETAEAALQVKKEFAKPEVEGGVCQGCLDKGMDYCATWNVCIERAQRACNRADHVTGSETFAAKGFSMLCPQGDQLSMGRKFLEAKGHQNGIVKLKSGLMYRVLRAGKGLSHPTLQSRITYHYRITLIDGTEVHSTYKRGKPWEDSLEGSIPGFIEALQLMVEGDHWTLYLPSELAYGSKGRDIIPAGAALVFMVHLLQVAEKTDL